MEQSMPREGVAGIAGLGSLADQWPGASSRWHIQEHQRRDGVGPGGPAHWPRRPFGIGGFCDSVEPRGHGSRRHMEHVPTGILPPAHREAQWRSSGRYLEPVKHADDKKTGTKRVWHEPKEFGMGWTGTLNNYTGPRHFLPQKTTIEPGHKTSTQSYLVEQEMGMKKFVFSSSMGLQGVYEDGERRCLRPATEWSLDKLLTRKIRVDNLEDRRNGIGSANPGDKGYATAEHATEYNAKMVAENRSRGNMSRKVMSKIDASWSKSGADPMLDKKGRKMSDYIQIYCKTIYRKNSMYVHRNAAMSEIAEMAGEGGTRAMRVCFLGKLIPPENTMLEVGVRAKCTVELIAEDEPIAKKTAYSELERTRALTGEVDMVSTLCDLKLEDKYPPTQREDYEGAEKEEEDAA